MGYFYGALDDEHGAVKPLQSVKLVYQSYSRSRAALDPYEIDDEH